MPATALLFHQAAGQLQLVLNTLIRFKIQFWYHALLLLLQPAAAGVQGRSLPRARLPAAAAALLLALLACSCVHCQEEPVAAAAPEAAVPDAAAPEAAVPDAAVQMVSQAGCECLSTWYDAAGIERQGCANPDMDPMVSQQQ